MTSYSQYHLGSTTQSHEIVKEKHPLVAGAGEAAAVAYNAAASQGFSPYHNIGKCKSG